MRRGSGSRTDITCTEIPGRNRGTVARPAGAKAQSSSGLCGTAEAVPSRSRPGGGRAFPLSDDRLLFQNWVVAIGDQAAAHDLGVFDVGVGPDLHTEEFVDGRVVG